jgi:AhpD family alkylhydroperoxidase
MARIFPKAYKSYPWYLRLLFAFQKKKYGQVLEPVLLWGRTPPVFLSFLLMRKSLERKHSPLDPLLRALITTAVSQISSCSFCIDMNSAELLKRGGSKEKLLNLDQFDQSDLFNEQEKAALAYAKGIAKSDQKAEVFAKLKNHFSDDAIVELTSLVCFQLLSSKFNTALDVSAYGFCKTSIKNEGS